MIRDVAYGLGILLVTLLLYFAFFSHTYKPPPGLSPGKEPPDFNLKTIDGRTISLSDLRGKVVLINFWATWCPPCKEEIPLFIDVYKKYKDKGFEILAISTDTSAETVKKFANEYKIPFPVLVDDGKVSNLYSIQGLPTSLLIGRDGKIVKVKLGKYREIERDIKEIL